MPKAQRMTDAASIRDRIERLMLQIWLGSHSRMAKDLCVSRGAISNVLSGKRAAGRELLVAIAADPRVDAGWLLTGKGNALVQKQVEPSVTGICLPCALELLPGPVQQNHHLLHTDRLATTRSSYRLSRYWFCVPDDSPWIADPELKIEPGDQLLIETNQTYWESRKTNSRRQPCVVCLEDKKQALPAYVPQGEDDPRLYDIPLPGPAPECARGLRPLSLGPEVPEDSFDAANGSRMPTPPNIQTVGVAVDLTRHFASWNVP